MANWCRSILRVIGAESDVARFVAFIARDDDNQDGSLTQIADCSLQQRDSGRAKYEVLTKWTPPLDPLTEVSRQFPELTLHLEWDQPGDGLLGCATIVNGTRNVLELDDLVRLARYLLREVFPQRYRDEWEDEDGCEADLELGWEILREAVRLHCGVHEHEDEEDDGWTEVREFGRHLVRDWIGAKEEAVNWSEEGF